MIFIFAKEEEIKFKLDSKFPNLSPLQLEAIEKSWKEIKTKNPKIFSADSYGCSKVEFKDGKHVINMNKTDYKTYLWARKQKEYVPGTFSTGTHPIVKNPKNNCYYFVQKSSKVEIGKNKYDNIGGIIDYKEQINEKDFMRFIINETIREIKEETNATSIKSPKFIGVYYGYPKIPRIGLCVYIEAEITKLKDDENSIIFEVPENDLEKFLKENRANLHEVLIPQLEFYLAYLNRK